MVLDQNQQKGCKLFLSWGEKKSLSKIFSIGGHNHKRCLWTKRFITFSFMERGIKHHDKQLSLCWKSGTKGNSENPFHIPVYTKVGRNAAAPPLSHGISSLCWRNASKAALPNSCCPWDVKIWEQNPTEAPHNPSRIYISIYTGRRERKQRKEFICYMESTFMATKHQKLKGFVGFLVGFFDCL